MPGDFHPIGFDQVINAKQRISYASSTTNYYGLAAPGTEESAAGWQIRRETLDSQGRTTEINFANGSLGYGLVWDNRLTYDYR